MKEDEPNMDQRTREIFDFFRKLYPADNELGFDPSKLEMTAEERRECIDRREKLDIEQMKTGRKLILINE